MKRLLTWIMTAVMSLSPATAANTNTTEAANVEDTAIVAEAEAGAGIQDADEENSAADEIDYDALMDTYASDVQDWTYLAEEDVWVIPVNMRAPSDEPDGEAPADGERPELPDGETPADGDRPELPDGEAPADGERPELLDGETPVDGERPELPDGEVPTDAERPDAAPERPDGEAPADLPDDADEKGAPQERVALPLEGIPGSLVLGVDTDSDGSVDVTAESYTESVTGVLIWADGAELTELTLVESETE